MSDELFTIPPSTGDALANARAAFVRAGDAYHEALALLDEQGPEAQPAYDAARKAYEQAKADVMREELLRLNP